MERNQEEDKKTQYRINTQVIKNKQINGSLIIFLFVHKWGTLDKTES